MGTSIFLLVEILKLMNLDFFSPIKFYFVIRGADIRIQWWLLLAGRLFQFVCVCEILSKIHDNWLEPCQLSLIMSKCYYSLVDMDETWMIHNVTINIYILIFFFWNFMYKAEIQTNLRIYHLFRFNLFYHFCSGFIFHSID